jgi:hypothetical protein
VDLHQPVGLEELQLEVLEVRPVGLLEVQLQLEEPAVT